MAALESDGRHLTPTPPGGVMESGRLVVMAGSGVGRRIRVDTSVTIGRAPESTIVIDDAEVSRVHARIERDEQGCYGVMDLGSSNGTFVNGLRIAELTPLEFGDKLRLGKQLALLFVAHVPLDEQLLQRQRLEALGRMTAGVVHDFNNMLAAVMANLAFVDTLPGAERGSQEAEESLADMRAATKRAADLARRLLSFSRAAPGAHGVVDLSYICDEVVQLVRRTTPPTVRIESHAPAGLCVMADGAEIHQVVTNLCLNAKDALSDGGTISVTADKSTRAERARLGLGDEPHAVISVKDDGVGMDEATCAQIFEPFFTTKRNSGGTGLGLSTVKEVVTVHGGQIRVESAPGEGTVMSVYLPMLDEGRGRMATSLNGVVDTSEWAGRVVLLVDDEPVFRRSLARVLRQEGLEVLEASDGDEALRMFYDLAAKPSLVILDLDLPTINGDEVLERMIYDTPGTRVVCTSGHYDADRIRGLLDEGALGFLPKPIPHAVLIKEIGAAFRHRQSDPDITVRHLDPSPNDS